VLFRGLLGCQREKSVLRSFVVF